MNSSFVTDESSEQLWYEQSINAAVYIGAMAWGLHVAVFFKSVETTFKHKRSHAWLLLVGVLFALATVNIICSIHFNELAWIDYRSYPGGPLLFLTDQLALPVNAGANVVAAITLLVADAFLIYRCHRLWRRRYLTLLFCALFLSVTVLSVLHCVGVSQPHVGLWDGTTLRFSSPYTSLAMSLNILLTLALVWRLIGLTRQLPALAGPALDAYTSMEAMVVESALPYGLASAFAVVLYGTRNTGAALLGPLLVQLEGITVELVVIRVVRGHAWSATTARSVAETLPPLRPPAESLHCSVRLEGGAAYAADVFAMATLGDDCQLPDVKPKLPGFV